MIDVDAIERTVDHTLLEPTITREELKAFVFSSRDSLVASLCIPPRWVKEAVAFSEGKKPICTVVGFPNGYMHPKIKYMEAQQALKDGATEIDYVLCLGDVIAKNQQILFEMRAARELTEGYILKVIIEGGALSDDDIRFVVHLLNDTRIDFIKTSTGFKYPGVCLDMIDLIKKEIRPGIGIKASGGVRDLSTAEALLSHGATRLGASKLLSLCRERRACV